jgi:hypothetical protein
MSFEVEKLTDAHIIVFHFTEPFEADQDVAAANDITHTFIEEVGGTVGRIEDIHAIDLTFAGLVAGLSVSTQHIPGALTDPNVYGAFVGDSELVQLASEALHQDQYGHVNAPAFHTNEDAISYLATKLND